jgi:hypothetical protein
MSKWFFKKSNIECPIDLQTRLWMENAFMWLAKQYGKQNIQRKQTLLPTFKHFPVQYNSSNDSLIKTGEVVAKQMEIDFTLINLQIFNQGTQEIQGDFGFRIFTKVDKESEEQLASGLYFDKNEEGKYDIFIENRNLQDPESLVATLAHEFAHIKLLGEKRIDQNNESLTDLTTVIFGLGLFNANSSFKEHKNFDSWGYRSVGYLKQREWGYALALYSYYREEDEPEFVKYLTPNIKHDFKKSMNYINSNAEKVFKEKYTPGH